MTTSYPNRTAPVLRGAWILESITGTPPASPPPNVPALAGEPGRRAAADRARAARAAPQESGVHRLATASWIRSASRSRTSTPSARGATGSRDGDADRCFRAARRRHEGQRPDAAARCAARDPAAVRADADREAARLRARPRRRVLRHAGRCGRSSATPKRENYRFSAILAGDRDERAVPFQHRAGADDEFGRHARRPWRSKERDDVRHRRSICRGAPCCAESARRSRCRCSMRWSRRSRAKAAPAARHAWVRLLPARRDHEPSGRRRPKARLRADRRSSRRSRRSRSKMTIVSGLENKHASGPHARDHAGHVAVAA